MRRGAIAVPLLATLNVACSTPTRVDTDAPDDVRWVALVELDEGGVAERAGPLARWDEGALPLYASAGRDVLLMGYGDAQITSVAGEATAQEISAEALALAPTCAPALPAPLWGGRLVDGALAPAPVDTRPALTASWIDTSCPRSETLWVDTDCLDVRCPLLSQRAGCNFSLDLENCGFERPRATLGATGELCVDFEPTALGCTPADPPRGASGASLCETSAAGVCTLSWYSALTTIGARERRFALDVEQAVFRPVNVEAGPVVGPGIFAKGYAWDLAPIGRGALVAGPGRTASNYCEPDTATLLHRVDADSGLITTATAPPCLLRLASSPDDDTVVGVYLRGRDWWLGRFDAAGQLLAEGPADPRPADEGGVRRPDYARSTPNDLVRSPSGWVVLWRSNDPGPTLAFSYDAELRNVGRIQIDDRYGTSVAALDDGTVAVTTNESGELIYANPLDGTITRRSLLTGRSRSVMIAAIGLYSALKLGDRLIVASGAPPALHAISRRGTAERLAIAFDRDLIPHAAAVVPWRPDTLAVLGVTPGRSATLSLFDVDEHHFLPGTRDLGMSAASRIVADAADRLWILLPWTGEILLLESE